MICLLFVPASLQIVHAFETHQDVICLSDVEHHFHADDLECTLCHLQAESHGLIPKFSYHIPFSLESSEQVYAYKFHNNHQHLSYSLRGPPIF